LGEYTLLYKWQIGYGLSRDPQTGVLSYNENEIAKEWAYLKSS